ncbi:MAG: hypothetical protein DID91_2727703814 [Candidatus Nitrotoga sp. MKT]|nr:MAG: hypothetical protein DID91_2727703814 [Candidatus Nitrotoga sp. MKT]
MGLGGLMYYNLLCHSALASGQQGNIGLFNHAIFSWDMGEFVTR